MGDELELPAELVAELAATFEDPESGRRLLHTGVADLGGETPSALDTPRPPSLASIGAPDRSWPDLQTEALK